MKSIVYGVKCILKQDLFSKTIKEVDKLKKISDENKRYTELFKYILYVKNHINGFDLCTTPCVTEIEDWDDLYGCLEYFSDRWSISRLNRIYAFYERQDFKLDNGGNK